MHTGHIILVKAENHEDAISTVWTAVNTSDETWFAANWSDWAVVAHEGISESRWNMKDFLDKEDLYTGVNDHALSYETERDLFEKVVQHQLDQRANAFEGVIRSLKDAGVESVYDFNLDQDDQVSWQLRRLGTLASSIYNPDSKIFDLENYDANLKYFRADTEAGNTNWYAVVVDFHF